MSRSTLGLSGGLLGRRATAWRVRPGLGSVIVYKTARALRCEERMFERSTLPLSYAPLDRLPEERGLARREPTFNLRRRAKALLTVGCDSPRSWTCLHDPNLGVGQIRPARTKNYPA